MSDKSQSLDQAREAVQRRDFASAYSIYNGLLVDYPDDPDLLREYGIAKYEEYADLQEAAHLFERALAANPRSVETLLWVADLHAMGYGRGYRAAADAYRAAMQLEPDVADAYIGLGLLHRAPSRPVTLEEAIDAFRKATRIDPQRPDSHLDLGAALIEAGERELAAEGLRVAQQLLMANGEVRQARGVDSVLQRLSANQPIKSIAFSYQSPRYRQAAQGRGPAGETRVPPAP